MRKGLCLAVLLLSATALYAGTIHVPGDYTLIQAAVNAATAGDTVLVAAGTYDSLFYPPGVDTTRCVVYMKSGVSLIGAGIGQSIIDPQGNGRGIYCYGVASGLIQGFTMRNAFAQFYGGGLFCEQGSSPRVTLCEMSENGDGGILVNHGSSPDVDDCTIINNVYKRGGGVAIENSSAPTFTNCTIHGNTAPNAGGVLVETSSSPVFIDCVIDSNYTDAAGSGGGITVITASITLQRCEITRNRSGGKGGGMQAEDATVVLESTHVRNNVTLGADGPGGGIYAELANVTLTSCLVTGNQAPGSAAFSDGGGIFAFLVDPMTITNCTIADNETKAGGLGGGIYCWISSPTVDNTIIAFNTNGKGVHCEESSPSFTCTDIYGNDGGDAICGTDVSGNFSQDPEFCDNVNGDYKLAGTSPCLPGNHPNGASCGQIGAEGQGSCGIGVAEADDAAALRPVGPRATPNPFGPSTTIRFAVPRAGRVTVAVYNIRGQRVRMLEDASLLAGAHQVTWDGRDDAGRTASSGVYFYRVEGIGEKATGRLVLTR